MARWKSISLALDRQIWQEEPEKYFADCLKIQDKRGQIVPLAVNEHQKKVNRVIADQRRRGVPVRVVILKERQTGVSTNAESQMYHAVRFRPADAKVIAHDLETTTTLFRMARRFYDNLPPEEQLPTEATNRKEIIFARRDAGTGGSISVLTAGTKTAGRGTTTLYLHCSEVAYYENAEQVMTALLNSVPDVPESMVIIESTANGMGGYFCDFWNRAKAGNSEFAPIFLCWKDFPEYRMTPPDAKRFEADLTPYERKIQTQHQLSVDQLYWRRHVIENKLKGDAELFKQEFPLSDTEAFLTSGRGRFDRERLMDWPVEDPLRGFLQQEDAYGGGAIAFIPQRDRELRLWKRPQHGHEYVIGADSAQGIEIEGAPSDDKYDYSSAHVADRYTGEVVAHLHGHFEPKEFGRQLFFLGKWYNRAFIGVERDGNGMSVLDALEYLGYPDSLIYARTQSPEGTRYAKPQKGWITTPTTRPRMINRLADAVRDRSLIVHCRETQREFLTFVVNADGKPEAQQGSKDDRVFSLGITRMMLDAAPPEAVKPENLDEFAVPVRPISYRPSRYAAHV